MPQYFIENGVYIETLTDVPVNTRPPGSLPVQARPGPDYVRSGNSWVHVPPPVVVYIPQSVSKLQAKLAAGATVVAQINTFMNDPAAPWAMKTAWEDASELHRNSQMVDELAWVLGWSGPTLDAFFIAASQIQV